MPTARHGSCLRSAAVDLSPHLAASAASGRASAGSPGAGPARTTADRRSSGGRTRQGNQGRRSATSLLWAADLLTVSTLTFQDAVRRRSCARQCRAGLLSRLCLRKSPRGLSLLAPVQETLL